MFGKIFLKLSAADIWMAVGFFGQVVFGLRFIVQWIATERAKKSIIPLAFWYLSLVGTLILLAYSIYRKDPVFIAGFSLNLIIYVRNLYFIHIHPRKCAAAKKEIAANDEQ
ncbi:MAG TPA: lipid-A-disaccharide synthase N-terminal domain-containing protein [Phycisphaerae bacterium]|nr:lipid-A-disaccharide synthase N-terminal domain-containing protein [Phycisphaerae bacterium]HPS52518.1 lipid-A-disaccharide synthase N-terminal domain-containing protein [Phycisphaerae bacterium]